MGVLTSIFPIAYGMSKFVSGVLGSRTSPRLLLAGGLMATALMNIAFGFSTSMIWFSVFWTINGMLQGVGAPGCARILTSWFASKERGTYWGMWNIAHNLGGFLAPVLAGTAAKAFGWQWGGLGQSVLKGEGRMVSSGAALLLAWSIQERVTTLSCMRQCCCLV